MTSVPPAAGEHVVYKRKLNPNNPYGWKSSVNLA